MPPQPGATAGLRHNDISEQMHRATRQMSQAEIADTATYSAGRA
jgi:hypothetical protein